MDIYRPIEFRGKVKNKEDIDRLKDVKVEVYNGFVYGDVIQRMNGDVCIYNNLIVQVIPETLGQFTGEYDTNGTKIFEDDYIECRLDEKHTATGYVRFEAGSFVVKIQECSNKKLIHYSLVIDTFPELYVRGNKTDGEYKQ